MAGRKLLLSNLWVRDVVRYSHATSTAILLAHGAGAMVAPRKKARALALKAYQRAESPAALRMLRRRVARLLPGLSGERTCEPELPLGQREPTPLDRTLILKAPQANGEKGVLLVMLERNWERLLAGCSHDLAYLNERFDFIFSTSWSPTNYRVVAMLLERLKGPLFFQSCTYEEIPKLEAFHPRIKCLPTIACDWLNPEDYRPKPHGERQIDILMVANWAPFKRHFHLFAALAKMPKDLRVVLVGQKEQVYTLEARRQLAKELGVRQDVTFIESAPIERVRELQCDARTSVILSRREGCCVAVCESLFAGAAMGMLRGAVVGPTAYINERTGMLMGRRRLCVQLQELLERAPGLDPRGWAVENITCFRSGEKLNKTLRAHAAATGRPWTVDAVTPAWRPYPSYICAADAEGVRAVYEDLNRRFPLAFSERLVEGALRCASLESRNRLVSA